MASNSSTATGRQRCASTRWSTSPAGRCAAALPPLTVTGSQPTVACVNLSPSKISLPLAQVKDPTVLTFYVKTASDSDERAIHLSSDERTTRSILVRLSPHLAAEPRAPPFPQAAVLMRAPLGAAQDVLTCSCLQLCELRGIDPGDMVRVLCNFVLSHQPLPCHPSTFGAKPHTRLPAVLALFPPTPPSGPPAAVRKVRHQQARGDRPSRRRRCAGLCRGRGVLARRGACRVAHQEGRASVNVAQAVVRAQGGALVLVLQRASHGIVEGSRNHPAQDVHCRALCADVGGGEALRSRARGASLPKALCCPSPPDSSL